MSVIATGQITITDINDGGIIAGNINTTSPKVVSYNPDVSNEADIYSPNWSQIPYLTLTAEFHKLGIDDNLLDLNGIISSPKWEILINGISTEVTGGSIADLSGNESKNILTYKANPFDTIGTTVYGVTFTYSCSYYDSITLSSMPLTVSIDFAKVVNGIGSTYLTIRGEDGLTFVNKESSASTSWLTMLAELKTGNSIVTDAEYRWYQRDEFISHKYLASGAVTGATKLYLKNENGVADAESILIGDTIYVSDGVNIDGPFQVTAREVTGTNDNVTIDPGLNRDFSTGAIVYDKGFEIATGDGWRRIVIDESNYFYVNKPTSVSTPRDSTEEIDSNRLKIHSNAVLNVTTLKCRAQATSGSAGWQEATIDIYDIYDSYEIKIESTGGDVFKNGVGQSMLIARVFNNKGEEIWAFGGTRSSTPPANPSIGQWWHCNEPTSSSYNQMFECTSAAGTGTWTVGKYPYPAVNGKTLEFYWTMYNNSGVQQNFTSSHTSGWVYEGGSMAKKIGKSIIVTSDDVNIKATFSLDVFLVDP